MLVKLKLVTIVAERLLKDRLLGEIISLGAQGYTMSEASGSGTRGVRASEWEGLTVKIQSDLVASGSKELKARLVQLVEGGEKLLTLDSVWPSLRPA